jgi:hypothetical protein
MCPEATGDNFGVTGHGNDADAELLRQNTSDFGAGCAV